MIRLENKRQLFTLLGAAIWISGAALVAADGGDDRLQLFVLYSIPPLSIGAVLFWWFSREAAKPGSSANARDGEVVMAVTKVVLLIVGVVIGIGMVVVVLGLILSPSGELASRILALCVASVFLWLISLVITRWKGKEAPTNAGLAKKQGL